MPTVALKKSWATAVPHTPAACGSRQDCGPAAEGAALAVHEPDAVDEMLAACTQRTGLLLPFVRKAASVPGRYLPGYYRARG